MSSMILKAKVQQSGPPETPVIGSSAKTSAEFRMKEARGELFIYVRPSKKGGKPCHSI